MTLHYHDLPEIHGKERKERKERNTRKRNGRQDSGQKGDGRRGRHAEESTVEWNGLKTHFDLEKPKFWIDLTRTVCGTNCGEQVGESVLQRHLAMQVNE